MAFRKSTIAKNAGQSVLTNAPKTSYRSIGSDGKALLGLGINVSQAEKPSVHASKSEYKLSTLKLDTIDETATKGASALFSKRTANRSAIADSSAPKSRSASSLLSVPTAKRPSEARPAPVLNLDFIVQDLDEENEEQTFAPRTRTPNPFRSA